MASKGRGNTHGGATTPQDYEAKYLNLVGKMTNILESMEKRRMAPVPVPKPTIVAPAPTTYEKFTAEKFTGLEEAFIWLRQGNCIVVEYNAKFAKLSRCVPYVVEDELWKHRALMLEKELETSKSFAKRVASQKNSGTGSGLGPSGPSKKMKVSNNGKSSIETKTTFPASQFSNLAELRTGLLGAASKPSLMQHDHSGIEVDGTWQLWDLAVLVSCRDKAELELLTWTCRGRFHVFCCFGFEA
ncbi:hypothetical protein Nepgr_004044 [Nepenthes gracilis]|uniref:Retrotransposon gag domain-containing protein n=1 Tax=Nepenthes gracilis TaxID=150966 RepID=A0AAD3XEQ7_NEPGR|nr:hypothetical protein Nepgr_004044 [Nepenthes gracilis]